MNLLYFVKITLFLLLVASSQDAIGQDTIYYSANKMQKVKKAKAVFYTIEKHKVTDKKERKTEYWYSMDGTLVSNSAYVKYNDKYLLEGTSQKWFPDGQLQEESFYVEGKNEGQSSEWHPNGQQYYVSNYENGKLHGEFTAWYDSGKLKREDRYLEDQLIEGKCYNESGEEIPHYEFWVQPLYPGGIYEARKFIGNNFRYPEKVKSNVRGVIDVQFIVDKTGKISYVEVINGINSELDSEAVGVIRRLRKFEPALKDGIPQEVKFRMPINMSIEAGI
ncbi:TonB family protein [Sphingobacterium hungaricum]